MSPVSVGLDLLLATLLVAALGVGVRLNARLKALRDGQAAFARSVSELDGAAARAEAGLSALRAATVEAHDQLLARIEAARTLSTRLERATAEAETAVLRAERAAAPPSRPVLHAVPPAPTPVRAPERDEALRPAHDAPLRAARAAPPRAPDSSPDRAAAAASASPADEDGPLARFVARRTGTRS